MKNLLMKELRLALHPTAYIFLLCSVMLLIPNYIYYVAFFYMSLGIFFTCLNGRENHDIFYTMTLPVAKKDIVKARFIIVIALELLQMLLAVPFALLRQSMPIAGNIPGMDANIALFGLTFIMLGLFNYSFFSIYYKDTNKVGKSFIVGSIIEFVYMGIAEICANVVPFMKNYLDTDDSQYISYKLIVLAIGIVIYTILNILVYRKSVNNFDKLDI